MIEPRTEPKQSISRGCTLSYYITLPLACKWSQVSLKHNSEMGFLTSENKNSERLSNMFKVTQVGRIRGGGRQVLIEVLLIPKHITLFLSSAIATGWVTRGWTELGLPRISHLSHGLIQVHELQRLLFFLFTFYYAYIAFWFSNDLSTK